MYKKTILKKYILTSLILRRLAIVTSLKVTSQEYAQTTNYVLR